MGSAELDHHSFSSTAASCSKSLLNNHRTSPFSNPQRGIDQGVKSKNVASVSRVKRNGSTSEMEMEEEATGLPEEKAAVAKVKDQDEPIDFSWPRAASKVVFRPSSRETRVVESKTRREMRGHAEAKYLLSRIHSKPMKKEVEGSSEEGFMSNARLRRENDSSIKFLLNTNNHNESVLSQTQHSRTLPNPDPMNAFPSRILQNGGERDRYHHPTSNGNSHFDLPPNFLSSNVSEYHRSLPGARTFKCHKPYLPTTPLSVNPGVVDQYSSCLADGAIGLDRRMMDATQMASSMSNFEKIDLFQKLYQELQQQQRQQQESLTNGQFKLHGKDQMFSPRNFEVLQRSHAPAFPGDFFSSQANVNERVGGRRRRTTSPSAGSSKCSSPSPKSINGRSARSVLEQNLSPDLSHLSKSLLASSLANNHAENKGSTVISLSTSIPSGSSNESSLVERVSPNTSSESHNAISSLLLATDANALYHHHQQQQNGIKANVAAAALARESGTSNVRVENESQPSRKRSFPAEKKDDTYWEKRRKNNQAAKRSRDARRQKEEEIAARAAKLEQENLRLRVELETLRHECHTLRVMLYNLRHEYNEAP